MNNCLLDIVLTDIVEASFSQLVRPDRDTRRPVDEGEPPLFALLHGWIGDVTESWASCRQLGSHCSRGSSCCSGQRHIVGSVSSDKTTVGIMSLVFGHSSVTWLPVTQLPIQNKDFCHIHCSILMLVMPVIQFSNTT